MIDFRFLGSLPTWAGLGIATLLAIVAWGLYRREVRDLTSPFHWLLPTLRSAAIALAILMLLEPSLHRRSFEGQPGQVRMLIDATASMGILDKVSASSENRTRFDRAVDALLEGDTPLLAELASSNEVTVSRFVDNRQTRLWESTLEKSSELPSEELPWRPESWLGPTRLGEVLLAESLQSVASNQNNTNEAKDANETASGTESILNASSSLRPIVLFTDGQSNAGPSPVDTMDSFKSAGRPLFIVGMGETAEPNDAAVLSIEHPKQVFQTDTLRGTITIKDNLTPGQRMRIAIQYGSDAVWFKDLTSQGIGRRTIEFALPIETLVQKTLAAGLRGVDYARLPIALTAKIETNAGDLDADNDSKSLRFTATTRRQRVLLIDSRSRWETRYLRNALERDPNWTVDAYLVSAGENPKWYAQANDEKPFPTKQEQWFDYDLIITGELEPNSLNVNQLAWLIRAIEGSGCGWIILDGNRGSWQDSSYESLWKAMPVQFLAASTAVDQAFSAKPSSETSQLSVLQLATGTSEENNELWKSLPKLRFASSAVPLPGSEVLATLEAANESRPFIVTRQYGAGRVLYLSSDETWRWRYNVADLYHQKFWNQIARWVMRLPFAVESEYVSLDAGDATYELGQSVSIRARLKDSNGLPAASDLVEALLTRDGQTVSTVSLQPDVMFPGVYRGTADGLNTGVYQVQLQAAGFQRDALQASVEFAIFEPENPEMQLLACNEPLLKQMAEQTGGKYLPEARISELPDLLAPYSQGKIVESDILLWQSYLWFLPIVILLALEWWLRKRAGLI